MKSSRFFHRALVVSLTFSCLLGAQAPLVNRLGTPAWVTDAKYLLPAFEDAIDSAVRKFRSNYFNSPPSQAAVIGDITEPGHKVFTGSSSVSYNPDLMPTKTSDVIAVGSLVSHQPFLTSDRTRIYSELKFVPTEILIDRGSRIDRLTPIILLQEGGSIILNTGNIIRTAPPGGSSPLKLSTQYLLFLRYLPNEQAYKLIRAWDLSSDQPKPVMGDGHAGSADSASFTTSNNASFIATVKRSASEMF